jgi:hypothetical protein
MPIDGLVFKTHVLAIFEATFLRNSIHMLMQGIWLAKQRS